MCENSNDTVMKTSSITLHTVLVSVAILLSAAMSSCSNDKNRASTRDDRSMAQRAYNLGIEDANNIVSECHTESAIRIRLLDIRAKATHIKGRISEDAAHEYISGFKHALEHHGDTLASTLFD